MRKVSLFLASLLASFSSFSQAPVVINPTIPNPRPHLSPEEILKGGLRDFNHLKTKEVQQKPSGLKQRMIAYSGRATVNTVISPASTDSVRYVYSGNRGSYPSSQTGNCSTISRFDSSYHVQLPGTEIPLSNIYYSSYSYNSKDLPVKYNGYNDLGKLSVENWYTYFANDSVESIVTKFHVDSNVSFTQHVFFNQNGLIVKDSTMILTTHQGGFIDSVMDVKNVYFDAQGRVDYIDSTFKAHDANVDYIQQQTLRNYYSTLSSLYPDKDSINAITYDFMQNFVDTGVALANDYVYNSLNQLISATHYAHLSQGTDYTLLFKGSYSYNTDGQIETYLMQRFESGWINDSKEVYQYEHQVNTVYTWYSYSLDGPPTWMEVYKSVSVLNENNIIDSIKTYHYGDYVHLTTLPSNSYGNRTGENNFQISNEGYLVIYNSRSYYYDEFDDPTAISETNISGLELRLFPNPAGNSFQYQIGGKQPGSWQIAILDLSGRTLYKTRSEGDTGTIDISAFQPGIYVFSVLNPKDGKTGRIKFVKQ